MLLFFLGPFQFPIIGNLPFIIYVDQIQKLHKKYGDLFM